MGMRVSALPGDRHLPQRWPPGRQPAQLFRGRHPRPAGANIAFHLGRLGLLAIDPLRALHFALGVIVLLETTIGGRVIPSFTASALKGVRQWQSQPWDYAAIAATGLALLSWVVCGDEQWPAAVAVVAALLQTVRALGWNPWATRRVPLLWILHVSHLWIPLGLGLLAVTELGWLPRSAAIHALTIGATGGLVIGMITRTALGHTGRLLIAGRIEIAAYALVQMAGVARVLTITAIPAAAHTDVTDRQDDLCLPLAGPVLAAGTRPERSDASNGAE